MKISKHLLWLPALLAFTSLAFADSKPKLTLDEFFNSVSYNSVAISPDGNSVVIATERADWDQKIFRHDLWLYRDDAKDASPSRSTLIQLTQSGHDSEPKWSPDGHWIAFLSERKTSSEKDSDSDDNDNDNDKDSDKEVSQLYLISPAGGEAIALTQGEEEVHTFSWSADSRTIYFATRNPWTKTQKDDYKKQWKDVVQYRTAERGDTIFALDVATALAHNAAKGTKEESDTEKESDLTPGASPIATSPLRVEDLITSPDGSKLAFVTNSINQRAEKAEDVEIYVLNVAPASSPATADSENKPALAQPRQLTHNQALEGSLRWANDNRHVFFTSENDPNRPLPRSPTASLLGGQRHQCHRAVEQRLHRSNRALRGSRRLRTSLRSHRNRGLPSTPSPSPLTLCTNSADGQAPTKPSPQPLTLPALPSCIRRCRSRRSLYRGKHRQTRPCASHHVLQQTLHRA